MVTKMKNLIKLLEILSVATLVFMVLTTILKFWTDPGILTLLDSISPEDPDLKLLPNYQPQMPLDGILAFSIIVNLLFNILIFISVSVALYSLALILENQQKNRQKLSELTNQTRLESSPDNIKSDL